MSAEARSLIDSDRRGSNGGAGRRSAARVGAVPLDDVGTALY